FVAHLLPDADRAIALHVAVPAHGTDAGAFSSDLPSQKVEVRDRLHIGDTVVVLRDPHRPAGDHALALGGDLCRLLDQLARDTALLDDLFPTRVAKIFGEFLEAVRFLANELVIKHAPARYALGRARLLPSRLGGSLALPR